MISIAKSIKFGTETTSIMIDIIAKARTAERALHFLSFEEYSTLTVGSWPKRTPLATVVRKGCALSRFKITSNCHFDVARSVQCHRRIARNSRIMAVLQMAIKI